MPKRYTFNSPFTFAAIWDLLLALVTRQKSKLGISKIFEWTGEILECPISGNL